MYAGRRSVAERRSRASNLSSRISALPIEIQDNILQQYLQGIHRRSNAGRRNRLVLRNARYARGAISYARARVRRLRGRR